MVFQIPQGFELQSNKLMINLYLPTTGSNPMRKLQQQNIYMIFLFCTKHHNTTTQKPHDTNLIIAILFLSLSLSLSLSLGRSLSLPRSLSLSLALSLSLRLFCTVFKLSNLSFAYLHPFSHFISFCLFI